MSGGGPRVLGIDVGSRRVGVAVSDELGLVAQPLEVIDAGRGEEALLARIGDLCREHGVETVVIGLPLSLEGGDSGESARRARRLGERIAGRLAVRISYRDERFTTAEAERALVASGMRREQRRRVVDKVAAALMLQGYLDARRAD